MNTLWRKENNGSGYQNQYNISDSRIHWAETQQAWQTWTPLVYSFFDGGDYERPGVRWVGIDQDPISGDPGWDGQFEVPSEYNLAPGATSFSGYPLGLVVHNKYTDTVIFPLNNVYANMNAEPNGSYALFFGPFAAPTSTVWTHYDVDNVAPNYSPFYMEQEFIDTIFVRLVNNKKDKWIEGTTTHLSKINSAYDLNLTYNDYAFDFYIYGEHFLVKHQLYDPDKQSPEYVKVGHEYDYNLQSLPEGYGVSYVGGSVFITPLAVGWQRNLSADLGSGIKRQKFPVFSWSDLQEVPLFEVSRPTPRIEGLFTQLPMKET